MRPRYRTGQTVPRRRRMPWGALLGLVAFLAVVGLVGGWVVAYKASARDVSFTVTEKERVCSSSTDGNSDCKYLLFTDKGTFSVADGFIIWRFNSSDVYGQIKQGRTYQAEVIGWRLGFFSMYPNVVEAQEITQ